jgi:hypothetical protein
MNALYGLAFAVGTLMWRKSTASGTPLTRCISESSRMMGIITFCATMKGKILGRSMDFEQRGKRNSIYSRI